MSQVLKIMKNEGVSAYNRTVAAGVISGIALDVFGIICNNPDLTVGEVYKIYKEKNPNTTRSRNELAKRVSDLKSYGAVRTNGQTICGVTGRKAYTLVATGQVPNKADAPLANVNLTLPVEFTRNQVVVPLDYTPSDIGLALSTLKALRFQSYALSTMSKLLFFVPGLAAKNAQTQMALTIAIDTLSQANVK